MKRKFLIITATSYALLGNGAWAEARNFLIAGDCNGVETMGTVSFVEQSGKTLVRERLAFQGAGSAGWSDRIAEVASWSEQMSDGSVIVLSEHPSADATVQKTYSVNEGDISISGACNLKGSVIDPLGDISVPLVVEASTPEGTFSGGEITVQHDPFGSVLLLTNETEGHSCMAGIVSTKERAIGSDIAQISMALYQILGPSDCISDGAGSTLLLKGADADIIRLFRSSPKLRLKSSGTAERITSILAGNMSSAGGISVPLQTSSTDDVPWPKMVDLDGGLHGLGIDTKGLHLEMDTAEMRDLLGAELQTRDWNFFNAPGIDPNRIQRRDAQSMYSQTKAGGEIVESFAITLSQWHTGNRPLRIQRTVNVTNQNERPSLDVFLNAVKKKYGSYVSNQTSNPRAQLIEWYYDNGAFSSDCSSLEVPRRLIEAYGGNSKSRKRILEQVQSDGVCDGYVSIRFVVKSGYVTSYTVSIVDTKAIAFDAWNYHRVQDTMQRSYLERIKSQNTAEPEL